MQERTTDTIAFALRTYIERGNIDDINGFLVM